MNAEDEVPILKTSNKVLVRLSELLGSQLDGDSGLCSFRN